MRRRLSSVLAAALLLAGCGAADPARPAPTPSPSAAPDPVSTADPAPTAAPEPLTLDYDEIRPVAYLGSLPASQCSGYFTVSRDGRWGLMRADGTELLACASPVPISCCGVGQHWIYWPQPALGWDAFDALSAELEAAGDGSLCPGHGMMADSFLYDLDAGRIVYYRYTAPSDIYPMEEDAWQKYGGLLPVCPVHLTRESEEDPWSVGERQGSWFYIGQDGEAVRPNRDGEAVEAVAAGWFYREALAPVKVDGRWAYLDRSGRLATEAVYDPVYRGNYSASETETAPTQAACLQNGYAAVSRDGRWGLLAADGAEVIPCEQPGVAWEGTTLWVKSEDGWRKQELPRSS